MRRHTSPLGERVSPWGGGMAEDPPRRRAVFLGRPAGAFHRSHQGEPNETALALPPAPAMAFATYTLLSEYGMRKYNPWTVLLYGLLISTLFWNVLYSPLQAVLQFYAPVEWIWIAFIAVCGTVLPFGFYFEGIKRIRSTHASITATLEPITAGVISALFLGELLSPMQTLGGMLVIASIIGLQWKKENDDR